MENTNTEFCKNKNLMDVVVWRGDPFCFAEEPVGFFSCGSMCKEIPSLVNLQSTFTQRTETGVALNSRLYSQSRLLNQLLNHNKRVRPGYN